MTSHKQLQLEHAVLQERLAELEHAQAAADTRAVAEAAGKRSRGPGRATQASTTSAAEMYAHLANSSDWSSRQMGAIEGAARNAHAGPAMNLFAPPLALQLTRFCRCAAFVLCDGTCRLFVTARCAGAR